MIKYKKYIFPYAFSTLFIFFMQYYFWIAATGLDNYPIVTASRNLAIILSVFCIIFHWKIYSILNLKTLFLLIFTLILVIVGIYVSGGQTVAKLILFGIAVKDVPIKKVTRDLGISNIIIFICVAFMSVIGVAPTHVLIGGQSYLTLGFKNPNTLSILLFSLVAIYTYNNYEKMGFKEIVFTLLICIFVFVIFQSRSFIIVTVGLFLLEIIDKYLIKLSSLNKIWFFRILTLLMPMIITYISYFLSVNWNRYDLLRKINLLFSWRFWLWSKYTTAYKITPFGLNFDWETNGTLDNGYLVLLFRYGWVIWILYILIFTYTFYKAYKNDNSKLILLLIAYYIYFFTESYPMMVNANVPILCFFWYLWSSRKEISEDYYPIRSE